MAMDGNLVAVADMLVCADGACFGSMSNQHRIRVETFWDRYRGSIVCGFFLANLARILPATSLICAINNEVIYIQPTSDLPLILLRTDPATLDTAFAWIVSRLEHDLSWRYHYTAGQDLSESVITKQARAYCVQKPRPKLATRAFPGSREKLQVFLDRQVNGCELFHEADAMRA